MEPTHTHTHTQYKTKSIGGLKNIGHRYLDIYIGLDHKRWRKENNIGRNRAYEKLGVKLGDNPNHFRFMDSKDEIIKAIFCLRKMIKARKRKLEWRGYGKVEVLSQEELNNIHKSF